MNTKYGKEVISSFSKVVGGKYYEVFIVEGDRYYNVHVINEAYMDDECNTLQSEIPQSSVPNPKEYFDTKFLLGRLMEEFIWSEFYELGIISSTVTIHEIESHSQEMVDTY